MIKKFDKATLKLLRQELTKDLKKLESKYGLVFSLGSISYSQNLAMIKIEAGLGGQSAAKIIFRDYAVSYGLEPGDYSKSILINGSVYILVGIKPKNRSYPIIVWKQSTGKLYKFSDRVVVEALNASKLTAAAEL